MASCEVCGNEYEGAMELAVGGVAHPFDSFECAIHALAPNRPHCGRKIAGHGHETGGSMYWWAS